MNILDFIKNFTNKDISAFNDVKFKLGANLKFATITLVVIAFLLLIYLSIRSTRELKSKKKRFFLIACRTIALLFIMFIILQPMVELREINKIKKNIAVMLDASLSMGLKSNPQKFSRQDSLKKLITDNKDYFNNLEDDFNVDYYTFGNVLKKVTLQEFLSSDANQPATKIGESIEELKNINPKAEYSDILLFTDGSDNGKIASLSTDMKSDLDKELLAKYIQSLNVKIHTIACEGDEEKFPDVAIEKVSADQFGFIRTPFEIEVQIYANGVETPTIPVTLKEGNNVIKTEVLVVSKEETRYKVKMKFYPQKIGRLVYTVSVPTYSGELLPLNNAKSFFVNVIRDKTRVLFVVGNPTWDERFLRSTLESDPNIDLISFMILRTAYDYLNVPDKEMSLIPFPTHEIFDTELHTFDIAIFCNFDYSFYTSPAYLHNIRKYVIEDGGAFVMIGGGRSFSEGFYDGTPIADILPVELQRGTKLFSFGKFKPVITNEGNVHPILRIDYNEDKNRRAYESLPALEGINKVLKVKNDAVALMVHPRERNEHGAAPIVAISEIGKGRSMAIMTDTLWRWNFPYVGEGGSTRIYENFWHNSLKWLIKDPDLDLVKLSLPDSKFQSGTEVKVKLRALNHKYQPSERAKITAEVKTPDSKSLKLSFDKTEIVGEYSAKFIPNKEGVYVVEADATEGAIHLGKDAHPLIVEDAKDELINLEVNNALLEELAKVSKTVPLTTKTDNISQKLELDTTKEEQLLGRTEITFWDSRINFAIIILFLIIEWHIRRRGGLY